MRGLAERLRPRPFKEVVFGVFARELRPNSRFPEGMTERKASASATAIAKTDAGPSAALRFVQDDSICFGCRRISKCSSNSKSKTSADVGHRAALAK